MKSLSLFCLAAFVPVLCLFACSGKMKGTGRGDVSGDWLIHVDDGAFVGTDSLFLAPDSSFKECKGLVYTSADSGFEFSVGVKIGICGRWSLSGDSLMVTYDPATLHISTDRESFHLAATGERANADRLIGIMDGMYEDLDRHLCTMLHAEYARLYDKELSLGCVEHVDSRSLLLSSGGAKVLLSRCR